MGKKTFCGCLLAALILACGTAPDAVVAQVKKEDKATKKEDKKVKDKKDARGGVIEITKGRDDKFRFFVRDAEGKLLAMSSPGGLETTKEAEAAIDQLREVVAKAKVSVKEKSEK